MTDFFLLPSNLEPDTQEVLFKYFWTKWKSQTKTITKQTVQECKLTAWRLRCHRMPGAGAVPTLPMWDSRTLLSIPGEKYPPLMVSLFNTSTTVTITELLAVGLLSLSRPEAS